jgi:hypothetical protein
VPRQTGVDATRQDLLNLSAYFHEKLIEQIKYQETLTPEGLLNVIDDLTRHRELMFEVYKDAKIKDRCDPNKSYVDIDDETESLKKYELVLEKENAELQAFTSSTLSKMKAAAIPTAVFLRQVSRCEANIKQEYEKYATSYEHFKTKNAKKRWCLKDVVDRYFAEKDFTDNVLFASSFLNEGGQPDYILAKLASMYASAKQIHTRVWFVDSESSRVEYKAWGSARSESHTQPSGHPEMAITLVNYPVSGTR